MLHKYKKSAREWGGCSELTLGPMDFGLGLSGLPEADWASSFQARAA